MKTFGRLQVGYRLKYHRPGWPRWTNRLSTMTRSVDKFKKEHIASGTTRTFEEWTSSGAWRLGDAPTDHIISFMYDDLLLKQLKYDKKNCYVELFVTHMDQRETVSSVYEAGMLLRLNEDTCCFVLSPPPTQRLCSFSVLLKKPFREVARAPARVSIIDITLDDVLMYTGVAVKCGRSTFIQCVCNGHVGWVMQSHVKHVNQ